MAKRRDENDRRELPEGADERERKGKRNGEGENLPVRARRRDPEPVEDDEVLYRPRKRGDDKNDRSRRDDERERDVTRAKPEKPPQDRFINQLLPAIYVVLALFFAASYLLSGVDGATGIVGSVVRTLFCGLLGWTAFLIPLLLIYLAIIWRRSIISHSLVVRVVFVSACLVLLAALTHVLSITGELSSGVYSFSVYASRIGDHWTDGVALKGGGFIGGFIGGLFANITGGVGTIIIFVSAILVSAIFILGTNPGDVAYEAYIKLRKFIRRRYEISKARRVEKKELEKRQKALEASGEPEEPTEGGRKVVRRTDPVAADREFGGGTDVLVSEAESDDGIPTIVPATDEKKDPYDPYGVKKKFSDEEDPEGFGSCYGDAKATKGKRVKSAAVSATVADDPKDAPLIVEKETPENIEEELGEADPDDEPTFSEPMKKKKKYLYPPTTLLKLDLSSDRDAIMAETHSTADKLIQTMRNFDIDVGKVEWSRGPAVTRYELEIQLTSKTRISRIEGLSKEIAYALATDDSVRIEAPIPGKSAVGVEVSNRVRTTVYLRELIESDKFRESQSKITACLGRDISGKIVVVDIAKMPHLLVAGTTGSGKSVCINSIIMSILYKASPEEVQLILIDPKKIEMGVYNSLPHLRVPVVTNMKKAAGTLNTMVNEMEHRYELFELYGSRNLAAYNSMAANDPSIKPLPQIVIVIDELADLMLTAPAQIEESIVRIAQKARAAGIHLVIGTQRPSVNVVTGLIKANIPSRIAFTTASQVDSRTIIDMVGAEKLTGRGDMLFAPVGTAKPRRVQGTFVADEEVERVTDFIRKNYGTAEYDEELIQQIEDEAEKFSNEKKKPSADDDEGVAVVEFADSFFQKSLEVAVEAGSIATSALQRKIGIGYGRAARIIDRMEQLGFVAKQVGNKPREVLLTQTQFNEMLMAHDPRLQGRKSADD